MGHLPAETALAGGHGACLGEPRFVKLNNEVSDDVASRIDGHGACLSEATFAALHDRYVC